MVCLNKNISFDKNKLKKNIQNELAEEINNNFYLNNMPSLIKLEKYIKLELNDFIIKKVNKLINNKIDKLFSNDYFIYKNMDENVCVHKFQKGKKEGYFCTKKITKNGDKSKYVCTQHNKNHIPKKKIIKNKQINSITNKSNDISLSSIYIDKPLSNLYMKKNNKKIYKNNKNSRTKKIIIKGIINFKNILEKLLL